MAFARTPKTMFVISIMTLALIATACGASASPAAEPATSESVDAPELEESSSDAATSGPAPGAEVGEAISIPNDGTTALEGHTPRGFAGSGVGLFAGDNLNPNFPEGEGIQILLTFAIPEGTEVPTQATLVSTALTERGNAFEALGPLRAAPVAFETFGPPLFEIQPTGALTICERESDTAISCDVTAGAQAAIEAGSDLVQLQLTFQEESDNDGEQDLALFFLTDSNTNEPGIFFLELS